MALSSMSIASQILYYLSIGFTMAIIVGVIYHLRTRGSDTPSPLERDEGVKRSRIVRRAPLVLLEQTILKAIQEGKFEVELLLAGDGEVPMFDKMWRLTIRATNPEGEAEPKKPQKRRPFRRVA